MSARAKLGFVLFLLVASVSCSAPTESAWRVRFGGDGGVVGETAVRVRLRVLVDSCESTAVVYDADISREESVPAFGEVGEGTFAFEATARDAECRIGDEPGAPGARSPEPNPPPATHSARSPRS